MRKALDVHRAPQDGELAAIITSMTILHSRLVEEIQEICRRIVPALPDLRVFGVPVDLLQVVDFVHDERIVTGILAWLFGPANVDVFGGESPLRTFLRIVASQADSSTLSAIGEGRFTLYRESSIEGGRSPDLWIEVSDSKQVIVIEIKLDSAESFY